MQRIRIDQKTKKPRMDQYAVLAFDPRDPDVVRAKEAMRRHPSNASRSAAHGA